MEFLLTLRRRGIADQAVLRAMDEVPREYFVETAFAASAYAFVCVLTGHGLKDPQTALAQAGAVVPCEPDISAVESAVLT